MNKQISICIEIGQMVYLKMHNGTEKKFIFKTLKGIKTFKRIVQNNNYSITFLSNKIQLVDLEKELLYSLKVSYIY